MKDLAPKIFRKRLIIEGKYTAPVSQEFLENYLTDLTDEIGMVKVFGPMVISEAEKVNPFHKGYEGFLIWAESGAHLYTWTDHNFFTVDIYTCKDFDEKKAVSFTRGRFKASDLEHKLV